MCPALAALSGRLVHDGSRAALQRLPCCQFCVPTLPGTSLLPFCRAQHHRLAQTPSSGRVSTGIVADTGLVICRRLLCSYAGVFDGHGGAPDAAELAARRMHKLLAEELGASASE
jgi:hypothetical protein